MMSGTAAIPIDFGFGVVARQREADGAVGGGIGDAMARMTCEGSSEAEVQAEPELQRNAQLVQQQQDGFAFDTQTQYCRC